MPTSLNLPIPNVLPLAQPANGNFVMAGNTPQTKPTIYFNDRVLVDEHIVEQNSWQTLGNNFRKGFVDLPKAIRRGLRGDKDYSFGDFLLLGNVPYYLGGATLAAVFASGRHGLTMARQGPAIILYYLTIGLANKGINQLVKHRTGVDLNLQYQTALGELKPVFGDPIFSRYDLVDEPRYHAMANKLGLPEDLTDRDGEVRQLIAEMLPRVRLAKAVFGNLLAAVAAGYLARTDDWGKVFTPIPGMSFRQAPLRRLWQGIKDSSRVIGTQLAGGPQAARLMRLTHKQFTRIHRVTGGLLWAGLTATGTLLRHLIPSREYDKSFQPGAWQPSGQITPAYLTPKLNKARQVWQKDRQRVIAWDHHDGVLPAIPTRATTIIGAIPIAAKAPPGTTTRTQPPHPTQGGLS